MMKLFALMLIAYLTLIITLPVFSQEENLNSNKSNEIILSDNELILIFSVAISVVIGIFLYLARHLFSRKKDEYEKENFDSKKNRDYEKYHSEWTSDDYNFGFKEKNENEFRKTQGSSSVPNYYKILGIPTDATQDDVKNRFRKLVKEWHPDKHKGKLTDKRMIEINKAYEVLSNEKRRKNYDKYLNLS